MSKTYLVTFGNQDCTKTKDRLANEAKNSGWFDGVFVYGEQDVSHFNKNLKGTGGGFWWWKPVIQQFALNQINENDILVYLDAGFYLNSYGKKIFDYYINKVKNNLGLLVFHAGDTEKMRTKRDLFKMMDCDYPEYFGTQIASGIFVARKNQLTIKLLEEFKKICNIDHAVNTEPSEYEEYPEFINHRHDQSVFSLTVKKLLKNQNIDLEELSTQKINGKIYNLDDEVNIVKQYFRDKDDSVLKELKFPFITCRLRDNDF